jgi:prophage antirepressor-like protein
MWIGEDDMKEVQTFMFKDFAVRAFEDNGEIYVVANDVCEALEFLNPRDAIRNHVDRGDVGKRDVMDNLGRNQSINCVNESGLYSLVFGSKKPAAKKFKRWVTSEVLPAIRKTGSYTSSSTVQDENGFRIDAAEYVRVMKENFDFKRKVNAAAYNEAIAIMEKRVACCLILKTSLPSEIIAEALGGSVAVVEFYRTEVERMSSNKLSDDENWQNMVEQIRCITATTLQ